MFVSTEMMEAPAVTDQRRGAIGVDLNADHLAVAETDSSGNYVNAWRVPLVSSSLASSERWMVLASGHGHASLKQNVWPSLTSKLNLVWRIVFGSERFLEPSTQSTIKSEG